MTSSALTQIAMFVLTILIAVLFINPTFAEIKNTQDDIFRYEDTLKKATDLNRELQNLLDTAASIRKADLERLKTFLPTTIDTLQVMADINTIASLSNLEITELSSIESPEVAQNIQLEDEALEDSGVREHDFNVTVSGEYEDLKLFLSNLEQNKYILEVADLTFGSDVNNEAARTTVAADSDTATNYSLTLRTYTLVYEFGANNRSTAAGIGLENELVNDSI